MKHVIKLWIYYSCLQSMVLMVSELFDQKVDPSLLVFSDSVRCHSLQCLTINTLMDKNYFNGVTDLAPEKRHQFLISSHTHLWYLTLSSECPESYLMYLIYTKSINSKYHSTLKHKSLRAWIDFTNALLNCSNITGR